MEQKRRLEEVRRYEHEVLGGIEKEKAVHFILFIIPFSYLLSFFDIHLLCS